MRDGWVETTLDRVTECSWGNTETTKSKYVASGYLAYSASGADGFLDWFEHDRTAVVLSAIGAQCGKTWFAEGQWTSIKNTIWLKSDNLNLLDKYLFYLSNRHQFWQIRGQAQPFISLGDVKKTKVLLPPLLEQRRIVDLISSVDSYIEALQRKLESAKRYRNAVLHHLLTGGGDDWVETTIGDLVRVSSGFAFSTKSWREHGIPVIKINNVRNGKVSIENCSYIQEPVPDGASRFLLKEGDLLITLTGEIGAIGFVTQSQPMYLNQRVGRLDLLARDRVSLKFIGLFLSLPKVRAEMWSHGKGNAQLNISPTSIQSISIDLPPLPEQKRITEIINAIDEVIDQIVITTNKAYDLRSGLLSDLLSGNHEIPTTYDKFFGAA